MPVARLLRSRACPDIDRGPRLTERRVHPLDDLRILAPGARVPMTDPRIAGVV